MKENKKFSLVRRAKSFTIDMDLTSPEFHPYARDTKDVAAGAVLISSIAAAIVGFIIFIPRLIFFI